MILEPKKQKTSAKKKKKKKRKSSWSKGNHIVRQARWRQSNGMDRYVCQWNWCLAVMSHTDGRDSFFPN